ncbi:MAG: NAD(P)H-dependent oxidoreductase subunit E [Gemmataceae bacterium]|nr:NAD(P)H-dependent oxidoreductase subunit E [Gemmataceae bacterium]
MSFLNSEITEKIRTLIGLYPARQAVTLPALHLVQDHYRCVPQAAIRDIAALLEVSPAEVHDTMSFYGFYKTEANPLGKNRLWVCRSLACELRGSEKVLEKIVQKLQVHPGQTTANGAITLEEAECIGVCEGAPCVLINDVPCSNVSLENVEKILDNLQK